MKGRRVYLNDDGTYPQLEPGDYCKQKDGSWMTCLPNGLLGCIKTHKVEEHEDGTITVSPSILTRGGEHDLSWHGYLEKGVWREC